MRNGARLKEQVEGGVTLKTIHHSLHLQTEHGHQFIDLTDRVAEIVEKSGIRQGLVNVQTRHTTTAIVINEHEPLLLEDMKVMLNSLASPAFEYQHNNFAIRAANLDPDESPNGHAHCQALFLRASETLNLIDGRLQLGRWQRIFLLELDHARERTVSIMVMGH